MLNFRNTTFCFVLLLLGLMGTQCFYHPVPLLAFVLLVFLYSLVLFYGSAYIQANFHLQAVSKANTAEKMLSITFDDGPLPDYTEAVLDVLKEYQIKACFFCIGNRIAGNEQLIQRIAEEGHILGNHSFSHSTFFDFYSSKTMEEEFRKTDELIFKSTGKKPRFFRPPYGVTTPAMKRAVKHLNYLTIGWNIRSFDTSTPDKAKVLERIKQAKKEGAILLLHDSLPDSASTLRSVLEYLLQAGYRIVPLDQLIQTHPYA